MSQYYIFSPLLLPFPPFSEQITVVCTKYFNLFLRLYSQYSHFPIKNPLCWSKIPTRGITKGRDLILACSQIFIYLCIEMQFYLSGLNLIGFRARLRLTLFPSWDKKIATFFGWVSSLFLYTKRSLHIFKGIHFLGGYEEGSFETL